MSWLGLALLTLVVALVAGAVGFSRSEPFDVDLEPDEEPRPMPSGTIAEQAAVVRRSTDRALDALQHVHDEAARLERWADPNREEDR